MVGEKNTVTLVLAFLACNYIMRFISRSKIVEPLMSIWKTILVNRFHVRLSLYYEVS